MISRLSGVVEEIIHDFVILDVGGVGYQVYCLLPTLKSFKLKEKCSLHIEMQVREDSIRLFGFLSLDEKEIFLLLQSVNGVGAKVALSILSQIEINDLCLAIKERNKNLLVAVQGIGPKTADRIIVELKNHKIFTAPNFYVESQRSDVRDATSALIAIGVSKSQAIAAVEKVLSKNPDAKIDDIIKQALSYTN
jgi:Holliday junction DNA helicase RuvA